MLNTPRSRWIAVGALAAILFAAGAAVAGDGARREGGRRGGKNRRAREAVVAREFGKIVKDRRQKMLKAMQRIDAMSDDQARAAFDASKDLGKIRDELRAKSATIVLQSFRDAKAAPDQRATIREATRAKVKALREEYKAPFLEAGMKVVRTLTPEQRTKIEEGAKARRKGGAKAATGEAKPVTDEQLAKHFGMRLAHPWAEALLKARVEGGATVPSNK